MAAGLSALAVAGTVGNATANTVPRQPKGSSMATPTATPLAQDYSVVWHNEDSMDYYVEGPGLLRLGDGEWLAVVPVIPRHSRPVFAERATRSRIHVLHSTDNGEHWEKRSELEHYSAVPWTHDGKLYLFANNGGTTHRNDDLLLRRSDDGGVTWTDPVTLLEGHYWNCHTGMVKQDGKLYWAVDDISFGMAKRGPKVVVGDLSADLMDPATWRFSNSVPFPGIPEGLYSADFATHGSQYLEPNVVAFQGQLRVLMTVKIKSQSTAGLCAVLDIEDDGENVSLTFSHFSPMPGGQLKFCVIHDDVSGLFWATANLVVDSQNRMKKTGYAGGNDRRFLMLLYSFDALNWFQAGCVAQAAKASQSFMYAVPVVDGDDLGIISRSAVNAQSAHDADYATFHRVRNFRRLALTLLSD